MMPRSDSRTELDLADLPRSVRETLETLLDGRTITLTRYGRELGTLSLQPAVLEGSVVLPERPTRTADVPFTAPEGVTVVATAMKLSDRARRRLSDSFGDDYIVLDLYEAPPTADVLLVHAVSPQLLGLLKSQFPMARVVITEIEDEELGVAYSGPVSRLLDAGASAYVPPRPVAQVADAVRSYLSGEDVPALEGGHSARKAAPQLNAAGSTAGDSGST